MVRLKSCSVSGASASKTTLQARSHRASSSARVCGGSANSASRLRLFAVGGQEIRPAGDPVAGEVLDDDGDGVGFRVQAYREVGVGDLGHGFFPKKLVVAQERVGILQVRRGELQGHAGILHPRASERKYRRWRRSRTCDRMLSPPVAAFPIQKEKPNELRDK
jgi:hypothetical protein